MSNETECWLYSAMHNASDMITVLEADRIIRYVSPAAERMLGYRPEELVGTLAFDYVHPEDVEFLSNSFAEALENPGLMPPIEFRLLAKDGSWRHVEVICNNQLDNPAVKGMVTTTRDITESRRSEERLRRQYNGFPIPTFSWCRVQDDFELVDYNEAADRTTLGRLAGLLGVRASEWYSDEPQMLEMLSRCFSEGIIVQGEIPWWMKTTGEHKHFAVTFAYVPPDLVIHHAEDVTERKRAEEGIRFQAKLLDTVGQAVIATDPQGKVLYWNRAAEELYGWSEEEVMGRSIMEVTPSDEMLEQAEVIMTELMAGRSWSGEFVVRRKDGTSFPAMVTDTPVQDEAGNLVAIIGVSMDITELKETEELRRSEERFRALTQNSSDIITLLGADGTIRYQSPSVERILGYRPEEMLGENVFGYVHPEDFGSVQGRFAESLADPDPRPSAEYRFRHRDGSWCYLESVGSNLLGDPTVGEFVVNSRDITERKRYEEAIERLSRHNQLILDSAGEGIYGLDREGRTTFVNPAAAALTGFGSEEVIGKDQHDTIHYSRPDGTPYPKEECPIHTTLRDGEVRQEDDEVFWRKDGTSFPVEYTSTPIREYGEVIGAVVTFTDITERKDAEKRLKYQATHDLLTDLPNRHLFMDRLTQALRRTRRRRKRKVAVLYLDLDNFKVVNDSLGHEAGDLLLVMMGERLRRSLRPEDTLARLGGDEFTVLVEDIESLEDAVRVAERIMEALREPFVLDARELALKPSIGIALGEARTKRPEELLRDADIAMYQAKGGDEGYYRVFAPAMYEQALRRLKLEGDLRRAIEDEEFVVYYQPIVNLETGEASGVEALVRWQHPEQGLISPSQFIPLAEEVGLVVPIGKLVLEQACRQGTRWQQEHPHIPPLVVSVNLSARQLQQPDVAELVKGILKKSGFDPHCLSLDITETVYIEALEDNTAALDKLKKMGVHISIDDFGTGYSSLAYLKRLPAGTLKIDKSFIKGIGEDIEDTAIVRMIIELAHTFGMEVIAEGVESQEQAEQLKEMGCDRGQGYYFARPLPSQEASKFLSR